MNAGAKGWTRSVLILAAVFLVLAVPIRAQDETEAEDDAVTGVGDWIVGYEAWDVQPAGLGFVAATVEDPLNPFDTEVQPVAFDAELRGRWKVGYVFPKRMGSLVLTWFSHKDVRFRHEFSPGRFLFVAQNITPGFAGVFDDGRADGYEAKASVVHRDLRLDFYRDAFRSARLKAKWFIGYRRVTHRRSMDSEYYALAPNLPPLLDPLTTPRADLIPTPDFSTTYSDVEVRGAQAGLEVTMPVFKDKVHFDAGFTLAVLRGRETTEYVGLTYGYARLEGTDVAEFLEPPFDELNLFEDPDNPGTGAPVDDIQQVLIPVSLDQTNDSTDSQILETFLGLRWRAWRNLEVSLGFRNARYDDIGVETYPRDDDGTNVQRETFSVNFEGYYLGAAYRW